MKLALVKGSDLGVQEYEIYQDLILALEIVVSPLEHLVEVVPVAELLELFAWKGIGYA